MAISQNNVISQCVKRSDDIAVKYNEGFVPPFKELCELNAMIFIKHSDIVKADLNEEQQEKLASLYNHLTI